MTLKRFIVGGTIVGALALALLFIAPLLNELKKPGPAAPWARPLKADIKRTATFATFLQEGKSLVKSPLLAKDGSRALFLLATEDKEEQLLLWRDGVGIEELRMGEPRSVSEYSADDSLKSAYFLVSGPDKAQRLLQWREGAGFNEPLDGSFRGSWSLVVAGDGSRLMFLPRDKRATYIKPDGGETSESGGYLAQLEENGELRLMPLEGLAYGSVAALNSEQYAVLEENSDGGGLLKLVRGRLKRLLKPGDIDLNGDGRVELLLIDKSVPGAPVWESFTASGEPGQPEKANPLYRYWRLGSSRGIPVPGDYNGDGITDLALYLPNFNPHAEAGGNWDIYLSERYLTGGAASPRRLQVNWGYGDMIAVVGDYDGDGLTDLGVFGPQTGDWRVMLAAGGFHRTKALASEPGYGIYRQWGLPGDIPVPGDYNGDGCSDFAVVRAEKSELVWYIKLLPCRGMEIESELRYVLGAPGDIPVPADFDGDGAVEPTVYRPSKNSWLNRTADGEVRTLRFGDRGGFPLALDFDGDGAADPVIYLPFGMTRWFVYNSGAPAALKEMIPNNAPVTTRLSWGGTTARPVQVVLSEHQRGVSTDQPSAHK